MEGQQPVTGERERRLSMRVPIDEKATLLLGHLASVTPCHLMDLSLDGCRVRTEAVIRLDRGAKVELVFRVGGTGFRLGGELEWTARSQEFGICFTGMSSRREEELVQALGELATQWEEKQARTMAAVESARAAVERLSAEFETKTAGESQARAELERATREAREANQRLEAAKKELIAAEVAARKMTAAAAEAENTNHTTETSAKEVPAKSQHETAAPATGRRERRQQPRHAVDSMATVFLVDVRSNVRGRIVDVSLSGCRIRSSDRFPVGIYRRVEVEFILDGLPFRLPGVVQSIHDKFTVGIRFVDLSERKREQLTLLMEELGDLARGAEVSGE